MFNLTSWCECQVRHLWLMNNSEHVSEMSLSVFHVCPGAIFKYLGQRNKMLFSQDNDTCLETHSRTLDF